MWLLYQISKQFEIYRKLIEVTFFILSICYLLSPEDSRTLVTWFKYFIIYWRCMVQNVQFSELLSAEDSRALVALFTLLSTEDSKTSHTYFNNLLSTEDKKTSVTYLNNLLSTKDNIKLVILFKSFTICWWMHQIDYFNLAICYLLKTTTYQVLLE